MGKSMASNLMFQREEVRKTCEHATLLIHVLL